MNEPVTQHPKLLLDPYGCWAAQEGVPIVDDLESIDAKFAV